MARRTRSFWRRSTGKERLHEYRGVKNGCGDIWNADLHLRCAGSGSANTVLRSLLPEDTGLCFAVKANPFLIPYVADLVDRLEVCSPGEYEICIQEQIAPEKIVVSGVNKTYESMKRILSYSKGAGIYTIESEEHAKILRTLAEKNQMPLSVLIRLRVAINSALMRRRSSGWQRRYRKARI